jgi:hypothetical protein
LHFRELLFVGFDHLAQFWVGIFSAFGPPSIEIFKGWLPIFIYEPSVEAPLIIIVPLVARCALRCGVSAKVNIEPGTVTSPTEDVPTLKPFSRSA